MKPVIAILLVLSSGSAHAASLMAGPMVSHTTTSEATIWVETDKPAKITVTYWSQSGEGATLVRDVAKGKTATTHPHTGTVKLTGLRAGTGVHYEVTVDGELIRPLSPQTFRTMPALQRRANDPDDLTAFSVAFGSCLNPTTQPQQPIFREMLQHRPSAFLFIGDINYMPESESHYGTDPELVRYAMAGYHRDVRHVPEVGAVMASTPSYGIWDDHDFGPGNSDRTFTFRDETLAIYKRYWPNSGAGSGATAGIFHKFQIADVEFIMLDDRYHRDPNKAEDRRTMFGDGQMVWLKESLKASTATFKVIANGNSMMVDFHRRNELWDNFGTERDDFIAWLFEEDINGVFFLAGDWHVGTLNKKYDEGYDYPLFELLSSNAAVRTDPIEDRTRTGWRENAQSASKRVRDYNFGLLRFAGRKGERTVSLRIVDEHGNVRIEQVLSETDLQEERSEDELPSTEF
jgi:alkaline phosphatase D